MNQPLNPPPEPPQSRKAVFRELVFLWFVVLLLIRLVVFLQSNLGLPEEVLAIVPLLFIYAPVVLCHLRGADSWSYNLSIPALRDGAAWWSALRLNLRMGLVIFPLFVVGYHIYQTQIFGLAPVELLPMEPLTLIAYQIFFVAIPEEFFYRGYFQTRLNEVYGRTFVVFGTPIGVGAIVANLFFAFGHSIVQFQWWHFATFFPGLVFAWMREKTGGVVGGALFHAACNILVIFLDTWYGLRLPAL